jgi:hypothetical protein
VPNRLPFRVSRRFEGDWTLPLGFTVISRYLFSLSNYSISTKKFGKTISLLSPWSSFYPLSFHHPILNGRITNFHFRDCSGGSPCSKAGFCVCTSSPISIRAKPTFVNASVIFGRQPPQLNYPPDTVSEAIQGIRRLDIKTFQGWCLICRLEGSHLLLNMKRPNQYQVVVKLHGVFSSSCGYSRIFTTLAFSPSPWLRQSLSSLCHSCGSELTRQGISLP